MKNKAFVKEKGNIFLDVNTPGAWAAGTIFPTTQIILRRVSRVLGSSIEVAFAVVKI